MPKVSLLIHTASADDFLVSQGIPSYFNALLWNLENQSFKDFELVYIDTYHDTNRETFRRYCEESDKEFKVKHVPVHPAHRYWFDRGYCFISAAKNTGILWADGELCVSCDDAEFFPEKFLGSYWHHYKSHGRYMHALHKRLRTLTVDAGLPEMPISGDEYVNDHRWKRVHGKMPVQHRFGALCYAGTSFSLADAMTLNGYNERMDGCKSLEDADFGNRLRLLGRSFALDPQGFLYILDHGSYADDPSAGQMPAEVRDGGDCQETPRPAVVRRKIENFIAVENHGMYRCGEELLDIAANKNPLTPEHFAIIQADTLKYRFFDPLGPENAEKLEIWKGTPTFDMKSQWAALRNTPEWKQYVA